MTEYVQNGGIQVAKELYDFINNQALPNTGIEAGDFWAKFDAIANDLAPKNRALLAKRDNLQTKIDAYHSARKGQAQNLTEYKAFLQEVGYLLPVGEDFAATTVNVEPEVAQMAGPQLVVPVMNARFALNAANARWGSLYDALYGTKAISEEDGATKGPGYNRVRGDKVIAYARGFLNDAAPLAVGDHADSTAYAVVDSALQVTLKDGSTSGLKDAKLQGYVGDAAAPTGILLANNGLRFEIQFDAASPIGSTDASGMKDILMESALTTIMDCEDSVACVDAEDKVVTYGNWLGLMRGDLSVEVKKGASSFTRTMNADREYTGLNGETFSVKGRSMLFIRNVGHLMTNPAILLNDGSEVPEGIMDAMMTVMIAMHDLKGMAPFQNSTTGSVNIVKPKMHGPEEVGLC